MENGCQILWKMWPGGSWKPTGRVPGASWGPAGSMWAPNPQKPGSWVIFGVPSWTPKIMVSKQKSRKNGVVKALEMKCWFWSLFKRFLMVFWRGWTLKNMVFAFEGCIFLSFLWSAIWTSKNAARLRFWRPFGGVGKASLGQLGPDLEVCWGFLMAWKMHPKKRRSKLV